MNFLLGVVKRYFVEIAVLRLKQKENQVTRTKSRGRGDEKLSSSVKFLSDSRVVSNRYEALTRLMVLFNILHKVFTNDKNASRTVVSWNCDKMVG